MDDASCFTCRADENKIMEKPNLKLVRFFTDHYKSGDIGIVGTRGTFGIGIREAQGIFKKSM
jgi:hypothetical protein